MAAQRIARQFAALQGQATLRLKDGAPLVTDNGQHILDVRGLRIADPLAFESEVNQWPGVVTVGVFAHQRAQVCFLLGTPSGVRTLRFDRAGRRSPPRASLEQRLLVAALRAMMAAALLAALVLACASARGPKRRPTRRPACVARLPPGSAVWAAAPTDARYLPEGMRAADAARLKLLVLRAADGAVRAFWLPQQDGRAGAGGGVARHAGHPVRRPGARLRGRRHRLPPGRAASTSRSATAGRCRAARSPPARPIGRRWRATRSMATGSCWPCAERPNSSKIRPGPAQNQRRQLLNS